MFTGLVLTHMNPVHIFLLYNIDIHFNIIHLFKLWCLTCYFHFRHCKLKFHISHVSHMSYIPLTTSLLDFLALIPFGEGYELGVFSPA